MRRLTAAAACASIVWSVAMTGESGSPWAVPRVLYLTQSAGYAHAVVPLSEEILREIGASTGSFDVTVSRDASTISDRSLQAFDVVSFYTTGELPLDDRQKDALMAFVRGGKGFVGIHSATDTFYKWPAYGEMVAGYFDGHPWHQPVKVRVEDPEHPATRHLPDGFTISDEIYQFRGWSRDRVHVLLSLDPGSVDLTKEGVRRTDRDFALAWTREEGKGRVFYTALGHEADVWRDTRFRQHLAGGIRWAAGVR